MTKWYAQLDGGPTGEVAYSSISKLLQTTPSHQWRRQSDGSLVVGYWRIWRKDGGK